MNRIKGDLSFRTTTIRSVNSTPGSKKRLHTDEKKTRSRAIFRAKSIFRRDLESNRTAMIASRSSFSCVCILPHHHGRKDKWIIRGFPRLFNRNRSRNNCGANSDTSIDAGITPPHCPDPPAPPPHFFTTRPNHPRSDSYVLLSIFNGILELCQLTRSGNVTAMNYTDQSLGPWIISNIRSIPKRNGKNEARETRWKSKIRAKRMG